MSSTAYFVPAERRVSYRATLHVLRTLGVRVKPLTAASPAASQAFVLAPTFADTRAGASVDDVQVALAAFRACFVDRNAAVSIVHWPVAHAIRSLLEAHGLRLAGSVSELLALCATFPPAIDERQLASLRESLRVRNARRLLHDLCAAPHDPSLQERARLLIEWARAQGRFGAEVPTDLRRALQTLANGDTSWTG